MFVLWLFPQTHQLAIYTQSMIKRVALVSSQVLALLGFFPYTILFSQSQINHPDPQMFFYRKKNLWPFLDEFELPEGQNKNYFEEAVYFLPLEIADTHFLSTSEGQSTQILKSDPKKAVSDVAKMLLLQVDKGFWLYYTSFCYKNI